MCDLSKLRGTPIDEPCSECDHLVAAHSVSTGECAICATRDQAIEVVREAIEEVERDHRRRSR